MSTKAFGEHVHVMDHPLVAHKLTIMRDKNTSVKDFRELVSEIGMLITYEATRNLPLTTKTVETPICTAEEPTLAGKKIAVVPILRAGLGLVDGVLRMVPSARPTSTLAFSVSATYISPPVTVMPLAPLKLLPPKSVISHLAAKLSSVITIRELLPSSM